MSSSEPVPQLPPGQRLLFSQDIEILEREEALGIYTLERVRVRRPGLIEAIIQITADGEGQLSIAHKLNCHHRTVSLVQRHPDFAEAIDIARSKRVARMNSAADKLVELIDNDPHSVPANMRALAASQLIDKAELLAGRATSRMERTEPHREIHDDWEAYLRTPGTCSPSEKQLGADQVREIEPAGPGMGLDGGEIPGNRALEDGAADGDPEPGSDAESAGQTAGHEATTTTATDSATDHDDRQAAADPTADLAAGARISSAQAGRGGSPHAPGVPIQPILPTDQKFSGNSPSPSNP